MNELRKMVDEAIQDLEKDELKPENVAISEIIKLERSYYYSTKSRSGRLREI